MRIQQIIKTGFVSFKKAHCSFLLLLLLPALVDKVLHYVLNFYNSKNKTTANNILNNNTYIFRIR